MSYEFFKKHECRPGMPCAGEVKMEEYAREPCPWRIVDDCGGAFTMGTIGGGIFQAIKGFRNSSGSKPQTTREFDSY